MMTAACLSALVLSALLVFVGWRARQFVRRHPEILTATTPYTYQRCHTTLDAVITHYKTIQHDDTPRIIGWQAPNGQLYIVSDEGIRQRRSIHADTDVYFLAWRDIGGVGVRMQPGFLSADKNRDGSPDRLYTTGYSFHLLIVPITGQTMDIPIPLNQQDDAVRFVAHTIALAERKGRRINVFGFDKPPAPQRQKIRRI
jgi:hypothetical protein